MEKKDARRLAKKQAAEHLEDAARELRDHLDDPDDREAVEYARQAIEAARGLLTNGALPKATAPAPRRG